MNILGYLSVRLVTGEKDSVFNHYNLVDNFFVSSFFYCFLPFLKFIRCSVSHIFLFGFGSYRLKFYDPKVPSEPPGKHLYHLHLTANVSKYKDFQYFILLLNRQES